MGVPGSQQRQTIMSAFEDEFEIPAASEVDPAAEFLAKEQEELGDIGQDLGLGAPAQTEDVLAPANEEEDDGKDIYAGMQTLSIKKDKEEPEFMRKWKEEQQERLRKKDEEESAAMEETKYDNIEMNGIEPGTEWERVSKHCDFSSKAPGHTKDVSRMRSIMLQLKQNQTVKA